MRPPTERSAIGLAAAIRAGELSSRQVVSAHIERLAERAPQLNAIAADRFEAALRESDAADQRLALARQALRTGVEEPDRASLGASGPIRLPPLLGVPFTVKETIALQGMPTTAGVLARRGRLATETAPAVQRLIDAGAIPLGVTNTSELTLWIESDNPLYGRTSNPYDSSRTAGGSSGGEGAAVGSGGSPVGIASDIAGSIRIPAFFCGVFGHKPSRGLVPNTGLWPPSTGSSGDLLGTGPLARRAEDLMPILRLMAGPDGLDPVAIPAELGEPAEVSIEGLTVTVVEGASRLPMSHELRDARERAVGALLARGARLRRVHLRTWRRALLPYLETLQAASADPTARSTSQLLVESGEPRPTWRSVLSRRSRHSGPTRVALAAELLPRPDEETPGQRTRLRAGRDLADALCDAIGDGVLLHPVHRRVAPRHRATLGRPWLMVPAAVFNLAGVPVTEVPLGLNEAGLPLGVQVAAARGADHVSIAVALELERVFGGWVPPPPPTVSPNGSSGRR